MSNSESSSPPSVKFRLCTRAQVEVPVKKFGGASAPYHLPLLPPQPASTQILHLCGHSDMDKGAPLHAMRLLREPRLHSRSRSLADRRTIDRMLLFMQPGRSRQTASVVAVVLDFSLSDALFLMRPNLSVVAAPYFSSSRTSIAGMNSFTMSAECAQINCIHSMR